MWTYGSVWMWTYGPVWMSASLEYLVGSMSRRRYPVTALLVFPHMNSHFTTASALRMYYRLAGCVCEYG